MRSPKRRALIGAALAAIPGLLVARHAIAASDTWAGTNSGTWSDPGNWAVSGSQPPANGDTLTFDDSGTTLSNTDDMVGLSVAGLKFAGTTNAYTLNGTTPLTLTGGTTAVQNTSSVSQTVNLPLAYGVNTTITGGSSAASLLAVNGQVNNTAASGNVTLSLSGVGTITDNFTATVAATGTTLTAPNTGDNWTILDNATSTPITIATASIVSGSGTLNFGTPTSAPNLTITATASVGDHTIGPDPGATGTFNMVNGTLLLKTRINTKNGNINVSGGAMQVWNQFQMDNTASTETSILTVSGGSLDVRNSSGSATTGGAIFVASRGTGTFNMNNGTVICGNLDCSRGAAAGAAIGVVNLNGGVLNPTVVSTATANESASNVGSSGTFNFNGGTLKARSTQANFITSGGSPAIPLTVNVKAGGAIIDSNNVNIGTSKPLQHDAGLGATPDGGLTKLNTGTLTLSGASTYTGPTTVKGGTLALSSTTSNDNISLSTLVIVGDLPANSAAKLDVSGVTTTGLFHLPTGDTLAGYGTVVGVSNVDAGATVAPGNNSIGTLSESTSMAIAGALNIDVNDANTPSVDLLNDTGALDISAATSSVSFNVTGTPTQTAYVFAKYGSLVGTAFGTVNNLPSGFSIDYNYQGGNQIALVQSVPEPTSIGLLAVTGAALLRRRRRNSPSN
jgi:autotransporter-associated beta strand protein